jgi:hypothetical protein
VWLAVSIEEDPLQKTVGPKTRVSVVVFDVLMPIRIRKEPEHNLFEVFELTFGFGSATILNHALELSEPIPLECHIQGYGSIDHQVHCRRIMLFRHSLLLSGLLQKARVTWDLRDHIP